MSFKKCPVVMLPTNEKAIINLNEYRKDVPTLNHSKEISNYETNPYQLIRDRGYQPQHLYILSDEEIKEGDWCYHSGRGIITQWFNRPGSYKEKDALRKIIATTDNSLGLPQPSQSFIEKYVEEYNKGNIITEVMVEYEIKSNAGLGHNEWVYLQHIEGKIYIPIKIEANIHQDTYELGKEDIFEDFEVETNLKINPKDNTITIKKVKDSWSKEDEDLRIAFEKFACAVYDENYNKDMSFKKISELMSKKWIKENL